VTSNAQEILDTILSRLKGLANTETVVGTPVQVGNVTLMPVVKLSVGFAAGGGGGEDPKNAGKGGGSGGGGGASINPIGFIVLDDNGVHFISVAAKGALDSLVDSVPELIKKFSSLRPKKDTADGKDDQSGE